MDVRSTALMDQMEHLQVLVGRGTNQLMDKDRNAKHNPQGRNIRQQNVSVPIGISSAVGTEQVLAR